MSKLNPGAAAWTPGFAPGGVSAGGLASLELPQSNRPQDGPQDEYDGAASEIERIDAQLDDYYDGTFETDHDLYEQQHQQLEQYQQWMAAAMQQQQQPVIYGNAAAGSAGAVGVGGAPAAPPPSLFPGGKMPETEDEWQAFNKELLEMQKKVIERQIADRKKRDEAADRRDERSANARAKAPLTANGKHRWPKNSAARKVEQVQKAAFESFATALLRAVSPFMAPLRKLTKTSLPHIKVDQRFGRRGHPESAVMQFIVAPVVVNYKPTHFHEVSPGDLLEFHYDFALVLQQLPSTNSIAINYGPEWKPFALPYCFVGCREYAHEVKRLCPDEIPNGRSEAVYEDDVVKDITAVLCAVEELEVLGQLSFSEAMRRRADLVPLYDVLNQFFAVIGEYQIQIRKVNETPSQYLLKTSLQVLKKSCALKPGVAADGPLRADSFVVPIGGDESVWDDLPVAQNTFQSGKTIVVAVDEVKQPTNLVVTKHEPAAPHATQPAANGKGPATATVAATTATAAVGAAPRAAAPKGGKKAQGGVSVPAALAIGAMCVAASAVAIGIIARRK